MALFLCKAFIFREIKEKSFHAKSKEEKEEIETDYQRQIEKVGLLDLLASRYVQLL